MSRVTRRVTCSLIILTICTGFGDGRWRTKERRKLERDILMLRKMADKIEREAEDYYDAHDLEQTNKLVHNHFGIGNKNESTEFSHNHRYLGHRDGADVYPAVDTVSTTSHVNNIEAPSLKLENNTILQDSPVQRAWPSFEDLLNSIGRKYDWKNDRWIKIKYKINSTSNDPTKQNFRNSFNSTHHFKYKYVKLNRSKSKRNVIIAVKAVR